MYILPTIPTVHTKSLFSSPLCVFLPLLTPYIPSIVHNNTGHTSDSMVCAVFFVGCQSLYLHTTHHKIRSRRTTSETTVSSAVGSPCIMNTRGYAYSRNYGSNRSGPYARRQSGSCLAPVILHLRAPESASSTVRYTRILLLCFCAALVKTSRSEHTVLTWETSHREENKAKINQHKWSWTPPKKGQLCRPQTSLVRTLC